MSRRCEIHSRYFYVYFCKIKILSSIIVIASMWNPRSALISKNYIQAEETCGFIMAANTTPLSQQDYQISC